MAVVAERHVVLLVLDQELGLGASMRLVAPQTAQRSFHFVDIRWIHHVRNRVPGYGVAQAIAERQDESLVLVEVVFGQPDLAVEDGQQVLGFQLLRH